MNIPESEKTTPTFRQGVLTFAVLCLLPFAAVAGVEDDYRAGLAAYSAGNLVGAMAPLKRAADAGYAPAQALFGDILDKAESNEEAIIYLRRAAAQNNADGQYGLAVMLLAGEGAPRDPAEAGRLLRAAAKQGHPLAINALAQAYIRKDGAMAADQQDSPEAQTVLIAAAESGYSPAVGALAKAYASGGFGLAPDPKLAKDWETRAAQLRGNARKAAK